MFERLLAATGGLLALRVWGGRTIAPNRAITVWRNGCCASVAEPNVHNNKELRAIAPGQQIAMVARTHSRVTGTMSDRYLAVTNAILGASLVVPRRPTENWNV